MNIAYLANYQGEELVAKRRLVRNRALAGSQKIATLAGLLAETGCRVKVFSLGAAAERSMRMYPASQGAIPGRNDIVVSYQCEWDVPLLGRVIGICALAAAVLKAHRETPFDAVLLYNSGLPEAAAAKILSWVAHVPIALEYEDDESRGPDGQRTWRQRVQSLGMRIIKRDVKGLVAVSPELARRFGISNTYVLRGALSRDLCEIPPPADAHQGLRFLFAGSLQAAKGVDRLCEAFIKLGIQGSELHIVGDGPMLDQMRAEFSSHQGIHFHGFVSRSELVELFKVAQVLVNPHRVAGEIGSVFPFKLIEYLGTGRPVISTPMAPLQGAIASGIVYTKSDSVEDLSQAMGYVSKNYRGMLVKARLSRDAAWKTYSPETVAQGILGILRKTAAVTPMNVDVQPHVCPSAADGTNLSDPRRRRTVLILADWYLPGYRAGGPIRSISHLVTQLGHRFRFKIVVRDRDLGDRQPYPNAVRNEWTRANNAEVMYLSPGIGSYVRTLKLLYSADKSTVVYLNSFFSRRSSILPVLARGIGVCRASHFVVAPRGEFSPGALEINPLRKKMYIAVARWLRLYEDIVWQASSEFELRDIQAQFGSVDDFHAPGGRPKPAHDHLKRTSIEVIVAGDVLCTPPLIHSKRRLKRPGRLKILFLSRISLMKNLDFALTLLCQVSGEVLFDIYGPIEDQGYWEECQRIVAKLPPNVQVAHLGDAPHEQVSGICRDHDLLVLPTRGENFGHVIFEALSAGCPVLISDRTPWRRLEQAGVGWDIALDRVDKFREVLQQCIDGDEEWLSEKSGRAILYALEMSANPEAAGANERLFERTLR
jgi:glycosyltransferase involved in cell wall biosynthesis